MTLLVYLLCLDATSPRVEEWSAIFASMYNEEKSFFIKQEFKEDMKDENSLSAYLKKPSQRLNEYILHLQVRESEHYLISVIYHLPLRVLK